MESNGPESYGPAWDRMLSEYPVRDAPWLRPSRGMFALDEAYYSASGGIFEEPEGYARLLK